MRPNSVKYLVGQGFRGIWYNRINSFASLCIITISLLMVGISVLLAININEMIGAIEDKNEVVVIIEDGTPDNNVTLLGEQIAANDNVFEVTFYSKEEAWESMQEGMTDEEKSLFELIDENPLPDSYKCRVSDITLLDETVAEIEQLASVESVSASTDFASILISIRNIAGILFTALTAALIVVCFVIISNTTRTSVYARRREINIMRYVGASKSFIRIPFFVEGVVIGALSSVIAYGLTWLAYINVYDTLSSDFEIWTIFGVNGLVQWTDIALVTAIAYLVAGVVISAIGTVLSTRKHLNV
ncbi:MAG: permease-like cell division protein FtsX [Oscillospiraceae bacterium]|nr:permease-like cell division protein FtsX [Oscillospiraceae bacterium]